MKIIKMDSNTYQHITAVGNIQLMLDYEGIEFIYCVYRTLLLRDPDPIGFEHYVNRMLNGSSKRIIALDIMQSDEAKTKKVTISGQELLTDNFYLSKLKRMSKKITTKSAVDTVISLPQSNENLNTVKLKRNAKSSSIAIWFDLTTSMMWSGGVVGIVRAELEIASGLHKLNKQILYSMLVDEKFLEIPHSELEWLFNAENVADAYTSFCKTRRINNASESRTFRVNTIPNQDEQSSWPYNSHDIVFSAGWMDSNKENIFSVVKQYDPLIKIGYIVYDTILANEDTSCFYAKSHQDNFLNYVKWISNTCDFTLFGGNTAQLDTLKLQEKMCWQSPPGAAIQFGTDIAKNLSAANSKETLHRLGVSQRFIITVGTLEPRKNHDTLYKAYLMALQIDPNHLPQLVICGKPMNSVKDLVDSLCRDPRIQGKIIQITPTDVELSILYKNCLFTVLPSVYEGWSLTLPESLGQGKFCLASDTPPLREIGKDMIDYVSPFDVKEWATKILHYSNNSALQQYENKIQTTWSNTKWLDTSAQILSYIEKLAHSDIKAKATPCIWLDISMSFLYWEGGISGIIRSELTFAKYIYELYPCVRFFAWSHSKYFEVQPDMLMWLFNSNDLTTNYKWFQDFWKHHESSGAGSRNPFASGVPSEDNPRILKTFTDNSIVLFTCIDWDQSRIKAAIEMGQKGRNILFSQLIYDMTPFLVPHLHAPATCAGYRPFVEYVSRNFDHIIYGGRTAMRDAITIQKENSWPTPMSDFIEFGSDISSSQPSNLDIEILRKFSIQEKFVLTVGTIEPRKNHETLYKAYLMMLSKDPSVDLPMLIIVGKKGWKSDDFLGVFELDKRITNKIIIISPSDAELDVLYRNCLFTALPSFYEGWSLTLPESLSYGKFCLTSKVDPLIETARDLVEYIDPLDTAEWGKRIYFYSQNLPLLREKEDFIKKHWEPLSWRRSARWLTDIVCDAHAKKYNPALVAKV
jgi:glycosyltransferase involved in cell wall biosynthesis